MTRDPESVLVTFDDIDAVAVRLPRWFARAACRGHPGSLWFPERGEQGAPAVEVCDRCPVRAECADYAIDQGFTDGIFGGLSPGARRARARTR